MWFFPRKSRECPRLAVRVAEREVLYLGTRCRGVRLGGEWWYPDAEGSLRRFAFQKRVKELSPADSPAQTD